MKCHRCQEDKLSKEFPFYPLTEDCDHPLLHCLDVSMLCFNSYRYKHVLWDLAKIENSRECVLMNVRSSLILKRINFRVIDIVIYNTI